MGLLKRRTLVYGLLFLIWVPMSWSQSGIGGTAAVSVQQGADDCGGNCVTVDVFADVSGLTGTGGDVGLNAFAIAFELDRTDVFASARPGENPSLEWAFLNTAATLVDATNRLTLVGVVADVTAPNQNYQLASVTFCGSAGDLTISFLPGESSLGSRVVGGDGPGPVPISAPVPFTVNLANAFPLDFGIGITQWGMLSPAYDLVEPNDRIDILDLTKLVNCGQP